MSTTTVSTSLSNPFPLPLQRRSFPSLQWEWERLSSSGGRTMDGRPLYAKYSLLGVSLVSLLRGACGR